MSDARTMLSDADLASLGLPPRESWLPEDWKAFLDGWSFQRLGFPAPTGLPPAMDRSLSRICAEVMGRATAAISSQLLPAHVRRAAFFRAGEHESLHVAAAA